MARKSRGPEVPDTMLPVQYFTRSQLADSPEKRLLFAVLMDAVSALQRGDVGAMSDAARWIHGESHGAPLRFADVCEALGIEVQGLTTALQSLCDRPGHVLRSRHRVAALRMIGSNGEDAARSVAHGDGRP